MKAELLPLKGKYYGTEVKIIFNKEYSEVLKLWDSGEFIPSVRQIEKSGYTQEQYDNNELVDNGWGELETVREAMDICDSHFESKTTYDRALEIIKRINFGQ